MTAHAAPSGGAGLPREVLPDLYALPPGAPGPAMRLEAREATAARRERFPALSLSPRGHVFREVPGFRGLSSLWVRTRH